LNCKAVHSVQGLKSKMLHNEELQELYYPSQCRQDDEIREDGMDSNELLRNSHKILVE
jgi:hypothetical protein